jgi:hypothetical protein
MIRLTSVCLLALALSGCAGTGAKIGGAMADAPQWLGGEPSDVPPRPGSPGYQDWLAQHPQHVTAPNTQATGNATAPDWIGH